MTLTSYIYRRCAGSRGPARRLWNIPRRILITLLHDPACSMMIHGRRLVLPLSHALPLSLTDHPLYDALPERLGRYVHDTDGYLKCIDVGANIGDSIAAFRRRQSDAFLAIEPNPRFLRYLRANFGHTRGVTILDCLCSSADATADYSVEEKAGTASLRRDPGGRRLEVRTLARLVQEHPTFADFNVLKMDTDGHDFEVLRGAGAVLGRNRPAILFECDVFSNATYVEDCLDTLSFLRGSGYDGFLLYDNFGYLMGQHPLDDLSGFRRLLFYQLTSPFYYFDILMLKRGDLDRFAESEAAFFVGRMADQTLQRTARFATGLD